MFHVKHLSWLKNANCSNPKTLVWKTREIEFMAKENTGKTDEIINKISVLLLNRVCPQNRLLCGRTLNSVNLFC